jgi:hypothetical protein
MRITGIDHVQLAMPAGQEEIAREFYARTLGIPEVPKPPDLAKRGGAWFESSGSARARPRRTRSEVTQQGP